VLNATIYLEAGLPAPAGPEGMDVRTTDSMPALWFRNMDGQAGTSNVAARSRVEMRSQRW